LPFTIKDVIQLLEKESAIRGVEAYRYVSKILKEAKELHRQYFLTTGKTDHEQSWRAFKGNNLERLLTHILDKEVGALGLKMVSGKALTSNQLSPMLDRVKRNLLVDYGQYGMHLPDVDLVIIDPVNGSVIAAVSVKVTLRERITQTGYWKLKLLKSPTTKDIKMYFVTLDEDGTLTTQSNPAKKGRAIVEEDTDSSYILSEAMIKESERVKMFDKFISDLKLIHEERNKKNSERLAIPYYHPRDIV
jgi:type II restriction enzyme